MEESRRQSIGAVVKTLRESAGLSRADLVRRTADAPAERIGIEMVAKVEQGRKAPSPASVAKLARALGIPVTDLARSAARWEAGAAVGVKDAALRQELLAVVRPTPPPAAPEPELAVAPPVADEIVDDVVEPEGRRADLVRQLETRVRELAWRGTVAQLEDAVLALQTRSMAPAAPARLASIDIGGRAG